MTEKRRQGERFNVAATEWNTFIDAADDFKRRTAQFRSRSRQGGIYPAAWLRNDTGAALDRLSVVGVGGVAIEPDENENEFVVRPVLIGVAPAEGQHEGRFAILAQPIANGAIGKAWVSGMAPVAIEGDGPFAEIADGVSGHLVSGDTGSATVLWREESTGAGLGLVRLGAGSGAVMDDIDAVIQSATPIGTGDAVQWEYTIKRAVKSAEGYGEWSVEGDALDAYNRCEDMNASAGTHYGNGLLRADLDTSAWTATLNPAPVGLLVRAKPRVIGEGTGQVTEYWFSHENSVTIECEEVAT